MLVRCKDRCKLSDGQTDGLLDLETNKVMCNLCGEELSNISDFTKTSMKMNGEVIKSKKKKAFTFKCLTCNDDVEAAMVGGIVVGKACKQDQKGCKLNVTQHMVKALEITSSYNVDEESADEPK